jgi:tRNA-Thr(GGU) m(6)t(6)A37 methyltransferase TsaA
MNEKYNYDLRPIGFIRSPLKSRADAPSQASEGAPDARIEIDASVAEGLDGIAPGDSIIVLTWFHQSQRDILKLHPRWDKANPLTGVFNTRSPDRPNPIGLHRAIVKQVLPYGLEIGAIEAIDGTPVIDIKPALDD